MGVIQTIPTATVKDATNVITLTPTSVVVSRTDQAPVLTFPSIAAFQAFVSVVLNARNYVRDNPGKFN